MSLSNRVSDGDLMKVLSSLYKTTVYARYDVAYDFIRIRIFDTIISVTCQHPGETRLDYLTRIVAEFRANGITLPSAEEKKRAIASAVLALNAKDAWI